MGKFSLGFILETLNKLKNEEDIKQNGRINTKSIS